MTLALTKEGQFKLETVENNLFYPIDAIYSSPLQELRNPKNHYRATQNKHQATYTDELLEVDLGPWSGLTKKDKKSLSRKATIWEKEPKELSIRRRRNSTN